MIVAVTGAGGWVGRAVIAALLDRGVEVRALARRPRDRRDIRWDLEDRDWRKSWAEILTGVDSIVHCAAAVHQHPRTRAEAARFDALNVGGTEKVMAAADGAGVGRFVFLSSVAIYEWGGETARSEDAAVAPTSAYAISKWRGEAVVQGFSGSWVCARLATVFGEGDRANFARLAAALRRGRFLIPGAGEARKSCIAVDTAGLALAELACNRAIDRAAVNVGSRCCPTLREICDGLSRCCGFPIARSVPRGLFTSAAIGCAVVGRAVTPLRSFGDALWKVMQSTPVETRRLWAAYPDLACRTFAEDLERAADYYRRI